MDLKILFNAVTMEYNYRLWQMGRCEHKKYSWFEPESMIVKNNRKEYLCIPESTYADINGEPHTGGLAVTLDDNFTPASFLTSNDKVIISDWVHYCRTDCFGTLLNFFDLINPSRRDSTMFHVIPLYYGGIEDASMKGDFTLISFKSHQEDRLELLLNGLISNIKSFNRDIKTKNRPKTEDDFINAEYYKAGLKTEFISAVVNYSGITDSQNWLVGLLSEPELTDYLLGAIFSPAPNIRVKKLSTGELVADCLTNIINKYQSTLPYIINSLINMDDDYVYKKLLDKLDIKTTVKKNKLSDKSIKCINDYLLKNGKLKIYDRLALGKSNWISDNKDSLSSVIDNIFNKGSVSDFDYLINELKNNNKKLPIVSDYQETLRKFVWDAKIDLLAKAIRALDKNNLPVYIPTDTDAYVKCTTILLGSFACKNITENQLYDNFMSLLGLMKRFDIDIEKNWTPDRLIRKLNFPAIS